MVIINKKYISFVIVAIFIVLVFLFIKNNNFQKKEIPLDKENINFVEISGKNVKVELALTQKEQEGGLSGRKSLNNDEGMLFIFPKASENYFWMKDMLFSIDIIWIDENQNVIYIEKNVVKESYPSYFGPAQKSKYVLEVYGGFSEKNNLKIGEKVKFLP